MRTARSCLLLALLAPALAKKGGAEDAEDTEGAGAEAAAAASQAKPVVSTPRPTRTARDVSLPNLPEFRLRAAATFR